MQARAAPTITDVVDHGVDMSKYGMKRCRWVVVAVVAEVICH